MKIGVPPPPPPKKKKKKTNKKINNNNNNNNNNHPNLHLSEIRIFEIDLLEQSVSCRFCVRYIHYSYHTG